MYDNITRGKLVAGYRTRTMQEIRDKFSILGTFRSKVEILCTHNLRHQTFAVLSVGKLQVLADSPQTFERTTSQ